MIEAVAFDLWHTLIEEPIPDYSAFLKRTRISPMKDVLQMEGFDVGEDALSLAYDRQTEKLLGLWKTSKDMKAEEQLSLLFEDLQIRMSDLRRGAVVSILEVYERALLAKPPVLIEGAKATIQELEGRYRLALISNTGRTGGRILRVLLDMHDLLSFFDVLIFSNEFGIRKPDKRIFQEALKRIGVLPSDAVHVGDDRQIDVEGAREAGMRAILLDGKNTWTETEARADLIIRDIRSLPPAIARLG